MRRERGFTLVELLIVIVLIGLFTYVVAEPLRSNIDPAARKDVCDSYKKRIFAAWEAYRVRHGLPENAVASAVTDERGNPVTLESLDGYGLSDGFKCPSGGQYKFQTGTNRVLCSVHDKDLW